MGELERGEGACENGEARWKAAIGIPFAVICGKTASEFPSVPYIGAGAEILLCSGDEFAFTCCDTGSNAGGGGVSGPTEEYGEGASCEKLMPSPKAALDSTSRSMLTLLIPSELTPTKPAFVVSTLSTGGLVGTGATAAGPF